MIELPALYADRISIVKGLLILLLIPVLLVSLSPGMARADSSSCKNWVTTSDACDDGACTNHGSWWCDLGVDLGDGGRCYGPAYYTSPTSRESIYWWSYQVSRNGAVCTDNCTKLTEQYQCLACSAPSKITGFGADKTVIAAGEIGDYSTLVKTADNT
ncbi:MAG TPA: hypothetical protein VMJ66_04020 [Geobacteraceae bacterium]|nr:hypothetical protein [Geobacteraceae bacterium]